MGFYSHRRLDSVSRGQYRREPRGKYDARAWEEKDTTQASQQQDLTNTGLNLNQGGQNLVYNSSFSLGADLANVVGVPASVVPDGWRVYSNGDNGTVGYGANGGSTVVSDGTGVEGGPFYKLAYLLNTTTKGIMCGSDFSTARFPTAGVRGGWQANKTYVISFFAKVSGYVATNEPTATMLLGWNTAPASTTELLNPPLTTAWQRYAFRITWGGSVESNGRLYISLTNSGGHASTPSAIMIDHVQVEEGIILTAYKPLTSPQNDDIVNRAGTATARTLVGTVYYRGNNSGTPVIASSDGNPATSPRLLINTIANRALSTFGYETTLRFQIQPQADTDNLDSIAYIEVGASYGTSGGTGNFLFGADNRIHVPINDRRHATPGTPTDASNQGLATYPLVSTSTSIYGLSGAATPIFLKCRIVTVDGQSTEHWFSPPSAAGTGSSSATGRWTDIGTTSPFSTGGGGGGGGGGSPPPGGGCPTPDVPVLLLGGGAVRAGELKVGDEVYTLPDPAVNPGGVWDVYPVEAVSRETNEISLLRFTDGSEVTFSKNHRLWVDGAWKEVRTLQVGDHVAGLEGTVKTVEMLAPFIGQRDVVRITVRDAHTVVLGGCYSHNAKAIE